MVAPENKCWGAGADKLSTVSGVKELNGQSQSHCLEKLKEKGHGYYESADSAYKLSTDGGLSKIVGGHNPQALLQRHP